MSGCSDDQLRDRSDRLESAADRIELVLSTYQPDQIEESVLAEAIIEALPESWREAGDNTIGVIGDTREAGQLLITKLNEASIALDAQADKEATETENAVFGVMSVAEALLGTNGLIAGIAGLFWRKKKKAEQDTQRAEQITEDIVTAIQSSPIVRKAIDEGGGDQVRASMPASAMRVVKKIKEAT